MVAIDTSEIAKQDRGFLITSSAFADNGLMDRRFAAKGGPRMCDGENISPPLQWLKAPQSTRSFAIIIHDAVGGLGKGIDHWIAYGIPASVSSFAEGAMSGSPNDGNYVGGANARGAETYYGPCPDIGDMPHHYEFKIIATDLEPDALEAGLDKADLMQALVGHMLGAASLIGRYARN